MSREYWSTKQGNGISYLGAEKPIVTPGAALASKAEHASLLGPQQRNAFGEHPKHGQTVRLTPFEDRPLDVRREEGQRRGATYLKLIWRGPEPALR